MAWTVELPSVSYCPSCGASLGVRETDDGDRPYCEDCGVTMYRNPLPTARATVVTDDAALLIEMGEGRDEGEWALAGGHPRPSETPRQAAARELEEETGLAVAPDALTLVGEGHLSFADGHALVSLNYAAPARAASGTVAAADDAAAARFWDRERLDALSDGLRASGVDQVRAAIETVGEGR